VKKTESQILATAHRMRERFADGALREVELRILELKEHSEIEAATFWREVREVLIELRGGESDHTKH